VSQRTFVLRLVNSGVGIASPSEARRIRVINVVAAIAIVVNVLFIVMQSVGIALGGLSTSEMGGVVVANAISLGVAIAVLLVNREGRVDLAMWLLFAGALGNTVVAAVFQGGDVHGEMFLLVLPAFAVLITPSPRAAHSFGGRSGPVDPGRQAATDCARPSARQPEPRAVSRFDGRAGVGRGTTGEGRPYSSHLHLQFEAGRGGRHQSRRRRLRLSPTEGAGRLKPFGSAPERGTGWPTSSVSTRQPSCKGSSCEFSTRTRSSPRSQSCEPEPQLPGRPEAMSFTT
jgi:hypothetical protein